MSQVDAIYVRISEDREGAGLGVERQEEDNRKLAALHGSASVRVYSDNDLSAYRRSARKPRKDYDRLLADIRAGEIARVFTWHTDRLHRSNVELEGYIDACQPANVPTYTVKAGLLDLATASGRLVARVLGTVARYESEHKSEQVTRAREQRVKNGGNAGGPRPFGYEHGGMELRAGEAAELARATQAVIDGATLVSLAKDLNARGILTSQGTTWTPQKLRSVLLRPRNAGILVYKGAEIGPAEWPAVVPELTWRQCKAVLGDEKRRTSYTNKIGSLGSGLYLCGICGAPMRIGMSGSKSKVRGYRCSARGHLTQAAAPLDEYVIRRLSAVFARAGLVLEYMRRLEEPGAGTAAQEKIHAAQKRLEELGTLFAAGDIDALTMKAATGKLRAEIAEAEKQIGEDARKLTREQEIAILDKFLYRPDRMMKDWPLDEQRWWLRYCATVTIMPAPARGGRFDPGRVRFEWKPEVRAAIEASKRRSEAWLDANPVYREAIRLVSEENGS